MPVGRLLVVEKGDRSLGVIDLDSGRRIGGVRSSDWTPHEVVATADGKRAFLPVYGDANLAHRACRVVRIVQSPLSGSMPTSRPSISAHFFQAISRSCRYDRCFSVYVCCTVSTCR